MCCCVSECVWVQHSGLCWLLQGVQSAHFAKNKYPVNLRDGRNCPTYDPHTLYPLKTHIHTHTHTKQTTTVLEVHCLFYALQHAEGFQTFQESNIRINIWRNLSWHFMRSKNIQSSFDFQLLLWENIFITKCWWLSCPLYQSPNKVSICDVIRLMGLLQINWTLGRASFQIRKLEQTENLKHS